MDRDRIIDRLKKIAALATSGERGEKETAQAMLDKLVQKYDVNIDDIVNSKAKEKTRKFKYKTKWEFRLIIQTIAWVTQEEVWGGKEGRAYYTRMTEEDFFLTEQALRILKKKWESDLDLFFHAFITKNKLFLYVQEKEEERDKEWLISVGQLANGIRAADINLKKALPGQ